MTEDILRAIARIFKVVVHAFDMGWHPTDTAFEKRKLKIFVAIQKAGAEHAG
jgi:hypothetical protein